MARSRTVEAPAQRDAYFGMVFVSFLATLLAVGLLAWELTSFYNWEMTPPALAAPNLPKVPERIKPQTQALAPVAEKPLATLTPAETPAPSPATPPVKEIKEPAPIPAVVTAKPVPAVVPAEKVPAEPAPTPTSSGPRPGFQIPRK